MPTYSSLTGAATKLNLSWHLHRIPTGSGTDLCTKVPQPKECCFTFFPDTFLCMGAMQRAH